MKEIKHGFLGKYFTYKKFGYEEPKVLTAEERAAEIASMIKPWKFEEAKIKPLFQFGMVGGSSQPSFDPMSLGNLQLWFDASDTDTLTLQGGNTYDDVMGWQSKGIIDLVLSPSSIDRAPYYYTNTQSIPMVVIGANQTTPANSVGLFNSNEYSMPLTSGYTAFIFANQPKLAPTSNIFNRELLILQQNDPTSSNSTFGQNRLAAGTITLNDFMRTGSTTGKQTGYVIPVTISAYTNTTTYSVYGVSMQYTGNTLNPLSSQSLFSGSMQNSTPRLAGFGFDNGFSGKTIDFFGLNSLQLTGSPLVGISNNTTSYREVSEILFYDKILTQAQVEQVVGYLNNKYTISASTGNKVFINYEMTGYTAEPSATTNQNTDLITYATGSRPLKFYYSTEGRAVVGVQGQEFLIQNPETIPAGKLTNWELTDVDGNIIEDEFDKPANSGGGVFALTASTYNLKMYVSDEP